MENAKTYIAMLGDILNAKEKVLTSVLQLTEKQSRVLTEENALDAFEATLDEKDQLIKELDRLDRGFSDAYTKVSAELAANKAAYKADIQTLQDKIKGLTVIGVKIQALEASNKLKVEEFLGSERSKIKNFKMSSKTVSSYYKNMTGKPQGESYFMDKKK